MFSRSSSKTKNWIYGKCSTVNQLIYQTVAPSKFSIEQGMFIEPIRLDRNGFA
jgi:hypothetical protein